MQIYEQAATFTFCFVTEREKARKVLALEKCSYVVAINTSDRLRRNSACILNMQKYLDAAVLGLNLDLAGWLYLAVVVVVVVVVLKGPVRTKKAYSV